MRLSISQFSKEEKRLIPQLYLEGYSIKDISELLDLSFQETLFILNRMFDYLDLPTVVSEYTINEERIVIISDTHIGSKYENIDYLKEVYRFAQNEGINTFIHGGDLIQSTYTNVLSKYVIEYNQLAHLIDAYPYDEKIINYILLGNHDFNTFKKAPNYLKMVEQERKDFRILGFRRAYLTWIKSLISIYHSTKKYPLIVPPIQTDLALKGHSHRLTYNNEGHISIPTLSDDLLQHKNAKPGFLVGTIKPDEIELESYYFTDSLHKDEKVLTKKLY